MADYSLVKAMLCSELKSLVSNNTQSNSYGYSYTIVSLLDEYFIFFKERIIIGEPQYNYFDHFFRYFIWKLFNK